MAQGDGGQDRRDRGAGEEWAAPTPLEMLETGVPNLDQILGGGLLRGATVMVVGAPGTGKTILAQQIAFHGARRGATALYLTGYSETHAKLLAHTRRLRFFAPALIGERLVLGSLPELLGRGAGETEDAIVATARQHRAALVVLDGFGNMRGFLGGEHHQAVAHFVYSLGAKLSLLGATLLVLAESNPDERDRYPELTVSDAVLALRRERQDSRQRRLLEVVKVRGAAPLNGFHPFTIDDDGVHLSPRLEAVVPAAEPVWTDERSDFGIAAVDALLGGGLTVGSATLAAGSPGTGKTLLGLHFAAQGARRGEPTLFLGFMESAGQLRAKARALGMDLAAAEAAGRVRLLVLPAYDLEADRVAELLRADVERRGVRRLVVDSAAELERGVAAEARRPEFLAALVGYLRGRNVTSYLTLDVPTIVGPELEFAGTPLSVVAENLLLLRYAEYRGALHRLFSVLKMRFSDYDRTIREYTITPGAGLQLLGAAPPAAGLLTGIAHPLAERPRGEGRWEGDARAPALERSEGADAPPPRRPWDREG